MYMAIGWMHVQAHGLRTRLAGQAGQGTIEYVALLVLLAGLFAALASVGPGDAAEGLAKKVHSEIKGAIDSVSSSKG